MAKRNNISVDVELSDNKLIFGVAEACIERGTDVVLGLLVAEIAVQKMEMGSNTIESGLSL